ncbi:MAG: hypothetical protein Q9N34_02115 [Aquificota bacterium]|nr:hypothetical protein [Aquificota bacterium]
MYDEACGFLSAEKTFGPIPRTALRGDLMGRIGDPHKTKSPAPFWMQKGGALQNLYPVRPLMCRLTVSKDRDLCKRDWENPRRIWSSELRPFIEKVRERFYSLWNLESAKLGLGEEEKGSSI